jgi:hypothetical protein
MLFANAHQGGLNYSRAGEAHLHHMLENGDRLQDDAHPSGHWVGQFDLFPHRLIDFP